MTSEYLGLILVYMATNHPLVNTPTGLPEADVSQNCGSFKGVKVALRKAAEYASLNDGTQREVNEVFQTRQWNGGYYVDLWLQYTVSATDEGYTITSHRWYSNPVA